MADPGGARLSLIAAQLGRGYTVACLGFTGALDQLAPIAQALGDSGLLIVLGSPDEPAAAVARPSAAAPPLAYVAATPAALPLLSHALDAVVVLVPLEGDTAAELRRVLAPGGAVYLVQGSEAAANRLQALGFTVRELELGVVVGAAPA